MKIKKIFILLNITLLLILGIAQLSSAAGYVPLAPIPGFTQTEGINDSDIGGYLKQLYVFGVGLASILAVMMIMWGGVEYMTTDAIGHKEEGKQKIQSAIMGLILAFGSFVILRTINADLVNINFSLWKSNLSVSKIETPVVNNFVSGINNDTNNYFNNINNAIKFSAIPDGTPFKPNLTAYSPEFAGGKMEGGYESSKPGLDGKSIVRTLDDYVQGNSTYVTLAGDPNQYGKTYIIPSLTYTNKSGVTQTLTNVTGYVHDTGSAFTGAGASHFDIPVGRDYGTDSKILNSQPFTGSNTAIVGGKIQ